MIKLCIFDLDGTLINSLNDLACAMNHALTKNRFPAHETERYRQMVGNGISVLADRAVAASAEHYTPSVKEAILSDFSAYYTAHCLDHTVPYPEIPSVLSDLDKAGILCAVNSNKPDHFTKHIVTSLFPSFSFASIFGKHDGIPCKPAPDGVRTILNTLSVVPSECIYIGDSNVDIRTARNAGILSIGVTWGFRTESELLSEGASYIAHTPTDIPSIVRALP